MIVAPMKPRSFPSASLVFVSAPLSQAGFDGNASWTSTFTCPDDTCSPTKESSSLNLGEAKKVRFNDADNEAYECLHARTSQEEWYTQSDFATFKSEMYSTVRAAIQEQHSLCDLISEAYEAISRNNSLAQDQEQRLATTLSHNIDLIGLEHHLVHSIAKDARCRREFLRDVVSDMMEDMLLDDANDTDLEELGDACFSISRVACFFAQHMAQAQA